MRTTLEIKRPLGLAGIFQVRVLVREGPFTRKVLVFRTLAPIQLNSTMLLLQTTVETHYEQSRFYI